MCSLTSCSHFIHYTHIHIHIHIKCERCAVSYFRNYLLHSLATPNSTANVILMPIANDCTKKKTGNISLIFIIYPPLPLLLPCY